MYLRQFKHILATGTSKISILNLHIKLLEQFEGLELSMTLLNLCSHNIEPNNPGIHNYSCRPCKASHTRTHTNIHTRTRKQTHTHRHTHACTITPAGLARQSAHSLWRWPANTLLPGARLVQHCGGGHRVQCERE
jgi:hypothetical protein